MSDRPVCHTCEACRHVFYEKTLGRLSSTHTLDPRDAYYLIITSNTVPRKRHTWWEYGGLGTDAEQTVSSCDRCRSQFADSRSEVESHLDTMHAWMSTLTRNRGCYFCIAAIFPVWKP